MDLFGVLTHRIEFIVIDHSIAEANILTNEYLKDNGSDIRIEDVHTKNASNKTKKLLQSKIRKLLPKGKMLVYSTDNRIYTGAYERLDKEIIVKRHPWWKRLFYRLTRRQL